MAARIPEVPSDQWSDDVQALLMATVAPVAKLEGGAAKSEPKPLGILTVLANQPRLLGPLLGWASAIVLEGALPRRDHETLALRAAVNCRSDFEWGHHAVYGRAAGLSDEEITRVVAGPDAPGWSDADATLLRAADELHRDAQIGDSTWAALATRYENAQLVEVPLVVGQYTMLSMLANAAGVPVEPGDEMIPRDSS